MMQHVAYKYRICIATKEGSSAFTVPELSMSREIAQELLEVFMRNSVSAHITVFDDKGARIWDVETKACY